MAKSHSPPDVQAADGWRGLDWCRRWDCYIAHTGVGHPTGMQLPTSYNASVQADSGLAGAFRRPAAWLPSGWPSPGAAGGAADAVGRSPAGQAGSSAGGSGQAGGGGPFKGRGHTLGISLGYTSICKHCNLQLGLPACTSREG